MNKIYLTVALAVWSFAAQAQDIVSVLRDIERNNLELQAIRNDNQATVFDSKGENTPDATSVEYSPFFRKGTDGVASSELVVSQEFDFPTLYAARHKATVLQEKALNLNYLASRREVLLSAEQKYFDLVWLDRQHAILTERLTNATEMQALFEKRFENGDATGIELNKIKMERMDLQTEMLQNESSRQIVIRELTALNGNQPLSLEGVAYPEEMRQKGAEGLFDDIIDSDIAIHAAEASFAASTQEVRVNKQAWAPKIAVGYRRNTELKESVHGFLIGASFPLFSNSHKVKAAKSRQAAAQLYLNDTRIQVENETKAQLHELGQLDKTLRIYDLELMRQTLRLLKKAVEAGNMSLIDYYTEADKVYAKWESFLLAENQYHKLWATLRKNEL